MRTRFTAAGLILFWIGAPASAHRLDEYLQAAMISVEKDRIQAQLRLTPGVAAFPVVFAAIDTNADGVLSETEQRTYAGRVLRDLSITIDGVHLKPRLVSMRFPGLGELREGLGEIQLELEADLPPGGVDRRLIFENHHQSLISAYLVNALVPRDPNIRIKEQNRNYQQSFYQLDYVQAAGLRLGPLSFTGWPTALAWLCAGLFLLARVGLFWRRRGNRAVSGLSENA
jgi:hypothetical protein